MGRERVVVTGAGIVSCLGCELDLFHQRLMRGQSGISLIDEFADCSTKFAGKATEWHPERWISKKLLRRLDPFTTYGLTAAHQALESASLHSEGSLEHLDLDRCGVVLGSGIGGMSVFQAGVMAAAESGPDRMSPFCIPFSLSGICGAMVAIETGFRGPNFPISVACATGNACILAAREMLANGCCDVVLAGGAEAGVNRVGLGGFAACRALSRRNESPQAASRPWDCDRDGFVLSEGAAVLVLESLSHAKRRGAEPLAELLGGASNCDAYHFTEPQPDGQQVLKCMQQALHDAGLHPEQIDLINCHATSTVAGDLCELKAITQLFKSSRNRVHIQATKSMIGHSLGAAGAMEAIAAIQALRYGEVHPSINIDRPEAILQDLQYHKEGVTNIPLRYAMSNSFGFGGHNTSIVLAKWCENPC